eukprot:TRINITY_DN107017_c0_g1_i1.p1 TRINITY_DN107017_c0_g1~~TRINITY_DN107017_c0_g1_i1.p1  ORF type:complete len:402 (+),score=54.55 TRINITY_DN107017_c0_g1_i1:79-1284(+)
MAQPCFAYRGRTQTLWTPEQLDAMGKISLKQRAMDLRDLVGDSMVLPPMPRNGGLADWILKVQAALLSNQGQSDQEDFRLQSGGYDEDDYGGRGAGQGFHPQSGGYDGDDYGSRGAGQDFHPQSGGYDGDDSGGRGVDQDFRPQSRGFSGSHQVDDDRYSDAGMSVAEGGNRMWDKRQLECMGKDALKQRAMNLRDAAGPNMNLPRMPRHVDLLPGWIISVQAAMANGLEVDQDPRAQRGPPNLFADGGEFSHPQPGGGMNDMYQARRMERDRVSNAGTNVPDGDVIWTEKQLYSMSKVSMKRRAMDLRDRYGAASCPPMPRHPDLLPNWIMSVQRAMQNEAWGDAGSRFEPPHRHELESREGFTKPRAQAYAGSDAGYSNAGESDVTRFRNRNMSSSVFG